MRQDVVLRLPSDLYVAAGARAMSILGNTVVVTVLLLDLHDRGAGSLAVAGVLVAGALPVVLLAPVVGSVVDRYDSRALIVASSLWQAVACVLLAFAGGSLQLVLALVALNACGTAVTNPLFLALTRAMVPRGRLAPANSMQQGAVTVAMMAGPAAGGLLVGVTGDARVPLLLDGLMFTLIAAASLLIGTRRRPPAEEPRVGGGVAMVLSDQALAAVVALAVLLPLVVHLIYVAQVFLVRDSFGAGPLAFGLLQATHMVGLLVGTVLASRLNTVRRIVFCTPVSAAVMALAIALIGVVRSLPATFGLYVVAGVCMSVVSVSMGTLLLARTPEAALGRVTAGVTAVHRAAGLVAYGLGGLVVGVLSPEVVYVVSGVAALVIVVALVPAFRRGWHQS
jgi:MFS family permease